MSKEEPKKETRPLDCKDGNGNAKPHYWHWTRDFKQRFCSTCGLAEDHPKEKKNA